MSKIFCPFVKGNCVPECIFNNGCLDANNPDNCNLYDAVSMIQSFGFSDVNLEDYLQNIDSELDSIRSNTGADQTDSSYIDSKLGRIESLLDEIKLKL